MTSQNRNLRVVFIAAICFVVVLSVFSYNRINALIDTSALVNHTTKVTLELEKVIGNLKDAETGHRGYLLTHDSLFLEPFTNGLIEYSQNIKELKQLTLENPEQHQSLETVERLANNREDYLYKTLEIDKVRTPSADELLFGKKIMDSLRTEVNIMITRENDLLGNRNEQLLKQTKIAPTLLLILSLLALVILVISFVKLNKSLIRAQKLKMEISDSILSRKLIEASEIELQSLVKQAPVSIVLFEGESLVTKIANETALQLMGKTAEEVLGKRIDDYFPDQLERKSIYLKVFKTGIPYLGKAVELKFTRSGQQHIGYYDLSYTPWYDVHGKIKGVMSVGVEVTEKILAQNKIEESKRLYETITQNTPDLIYVFDLNARFIYANEALLTMWGSNWEQSIGKSLLEIGYEPWHAEMHEREISEIKATKKSIRGEVSFPHATLGKRIYDYILVPVIDQHGNVEAIAGTTRDITQQNETRKQIEESEKRFRDMVEQAPVAICVLRGKNYVVELANEKQLILWGKTKEEVMNKPIFIAIPEGAGQGYEELLEGVFNTGKSFAAQEVPTTIIRNGRYETFYTNFVFEPLYNNEGIIDGIMSVASDSTEQVVSRKIIEESEERFRSLAETLPQLVWITDVHGNSEFASKRWEEYSGVKPGGEKEWKSIVHPDDYEAINAEWMNSLNTGNIYRYDVRLKNKEGEYRWFSVNGEPVLNAQNKIEKWVGAFTDIHDQKIKEEKKDEFISIASHEMKTPLTTAKAYLQMLELMLDNNNDEANLYAKKASQSVERLNELISELLDVSKIRLGKLNYTITTFNFNQLLDSTVENIQLTSTTHTIIKTGKVNDEVTGDKERLQQVIINLLTNAIKYSPRADKVFINIEQENDKIKVAVKDTGIGIAQQSLDKIFEKYHRVEEHSVRFQGLGIGLFISYEIIQRHHGKLWAESEPGKGSTFYFTLPVNINTHI
jgi:PAS domain S-box-containing protein